MLSVVSLETLKTKVPSIFTQAAAQQTSAKYQHISTIEIINKLGSEGFLPTSADQCLSRADENKAFTKHRVRFRHVEAKATQSGLFPEIILINSHDGLSSYRLMAGLYRLICSNGLVAGKEYEEVRIRHHGDIMHNVIEGTYEVIKNANKMIESADNMASISLNDAEKRLFAESAHTLRFEGNLTGEAFTASQLLNPRRSEETKNDLFTVFNVVQENIIKGGSRGYTKDRNGRGKRTRMRSIKSIEQNTTLNRALWTLAEEMAKLKRA